jgi:hypothetical protein
LQFIGVADETPAAFILVKSRRDALKPPGATRSNRIVRKPETFGS